MIDYLKFKDNFDLNKIFVYYGEFNCGTDSFIDNLTDFKNLYGDYNQYCYESVKTILDSNIPLNIKRVLNASSGYSQSDSYSRTACKFINIPEEISGTNVVSTLVSSLLSQSDTILYQITSDTNVLFEGDISDTFHYINDSTIEITSTFDLEDTITVKKFIFHNKVNNSFDYITHFRLDKLIGIADGSYTFNVNATIGKILQDDEIIFQQIGSTGDSPLGLTGVISNLSGSEIFEITFEVESFEISLNDNNYTVSQKNNTQITTENFPDFSSNGLHQIYDSTDNMFNYNIMSDNENDTQLCIFAKYVGLYGNLIKIKLRGKNNVLNNISDNEVVLDIIYDGVTVETHITSDFNIDSEYIHIVTTFNTTEFDFSDIFVECYLEHGNDGVITSQNYIDKIQPEDYLITLFDNNINYIDILPNIEIKNIILMNSSETFLDDNIFMFDSVIEREDFDIPLYFAMLPIISTTLIEYQTFKNITVDSTYLIKSGNKLDLINHFDGNVLQSELNTTDTQYLSRLLYSRYVLSIIKSSMQDLIFDSNNDIQSVIKTITTEFKIVSILLISSSDTEITLSVKFNFNDYVEEILLVVWW